MRKIDLTGRVYGRLKVIKEDLSKNSKNRYWLCRCDCGNPDLISIVQYSLTKENGTKSCGCLWRESIAGIQDDISGNTYGKLKVIKFNGRDEQGRAKWLCECLCGNTVVVDGYKLKSGHTQSCGCLKDDNFDDLTGQTFGRWKVLKRGSTYELNGTANWLCECQCENKIIKEVNATSLRLGKSQSCGCLQIEYVQNQTGENNPSWKGGITSLNKFLRKQLLEWKKLSIKNSNYKCAVSGLKSNSRFVVHHLYSFDLILNEFLKENPINLKDNIINYSVDELNEISKKFLQVHSKYPLGVFLSQEIHTLFHQEYGYGNNTPEQFEEFKQRYNDEEFNDYIEQQNKENIA